MSHEKRIDAVLRELEARKDEQCPFEQTASRALIDAALQKRLAMVHSATQLVFIGLVADLMQGPFQLSRQDAIDAVCKTHPAETQGFIKSAKALGGIIVPNIVIEGEPEIGYVDVRGRLC